MLVLKYNYSTIKRSEIKVEKWRKKMTANIGLHRRARTKLSNNFIYYIDKVWTAAKQKRFKVHEQNVLT